jgi:1-acyl-sn-glycerol-3-phosphate acyltransferase
MTESPSGAGKAVVKPVQRRIWRIAQQIVAPIVSRKYNGSFEQIGIDGPFLLVCNHACNADPIFVGLLSREKPLTYVASEHLERLGFVTTLLTRSFSIIPRKKASTAVDTVRSVLRALKQGASVVLFAEGECTWDGVSNEVFPATGKLAKISRVPLVTCRLEGNYLTKPRWAKASRRGSINGRVVRRYTPEELAKMSPEEITAAINCDIYENAWETQRRANAPFISGASAEGLERALFICPECGEMGSLRTNKNAIFCTKCNMRVTLDGSSFFQNGRFPTVREWDIWQQGELQRRMGTGEENAELFPAKGKMADLSGGTKKRVPFHLDLRRGAIVIDGKTIPLSDFTDMAMVKTNRLLFEWNGSYYEIVTKNGILRPYLLAKQFYSTEKGGE